MGEPATPPCSHVRKPECEALKDLPPFAVKLFVAVRYGQSEYTNIKAGVRGYEAWGISKDQAARGFRLLIQAGLLEVVREASFGAKRRQRLLRIVHTREKEQQSQGRDNAPAASRKGAPVIDLQSRRRDDKKPLQSHQRDIPKEPSSPSAQKAEGEEGSPPAAPPREGGAPPGSRDDLKENLRRASERSNERGLALWGLIVQAGGGAQAAGLKGALEGGREATAVPAPGGLPFVGLIAA